MTKLYPFTLGDHVQVLGLGDELFYITEIVNEDTALLKDAGGITKGKFHFKDFIFVPANRVETKRIYVRKK